MKDQEIKIEIGDNLKNCIYEIIKSSERKGYHISYVGEAIKNAFGIKISEEYLKKCQ